MRSALSGYIPSIQQSRMAEGSGDPVEDPLVSPHIELVDTQDSTLRDSITWEVHGAAGIGREHIHPQASKYVEARLRTWEPPVAWRGEWHPPLKLPKLGTRPYYKTTLAKWCPPMWWPPAVISEGQLAIWRVPGDRHRPPAQDLSSQEAPPLPPKQLHTPAAPRPEASHPGEEPPKSHLSLAEQAYTKLGEYEAARMRAYAHLKMPAPEIEIPVARTLRSDAIYHCRVVAPECQECNDKQAIIRHRRYLELYPQVPFNCLHKCAIQDLVI